MRITQRTGIIGIVLALVLIGGIWIWSPDAKAPETPAPIATSTPTQTDAEAPEVPTVLVHTTQDSIALKNAAEVKGTAALIVDGTPYQLTAPDGSTLKDAMDRLQIESDFTYGYKNYSGLGVFVTSLNNRASTGDGPGRAGRP